MSALQRLRDLGPTLTVGALSADLLHLGQQVVALARGGVQVLHVDIMDGAFCPLLTAGAPLVEALHRTGLMVDAHLMVADPLGQIEAMVSAGADIVTVHAESSIHTHRVLQALAPYAHDPQRGLVRGVGLNPGTPLTVLEPLVDEVEMVLLLAVNPGWGGQAFIESTIERARRVRDRLGDEVLICVDGGVKADNIARIAAESTADLIVSGSAVFKGGDPEGTARAMMESLRG